MKRVAAREPELPPGLVLHPTMTCERLLDLVGTELLRRRTHDGTDERLHFLRQIELAAPAARGGAHEEIRELADVRCVRVRDERPNEIARDARLAPFEE